jgi:squalene synthase HpnC
MTASAQLRSGKGHRDENFPVASWLIGAKHRPAILAFYEFARVADDIADHPTLRAGEKLVRLNRLEQSLLGENEDEREGVHLRGVLADRNLSSQHALDLLRAFRQDVTQDRYGGWNDLLDYCAYSAMPVGRFVLDVHHAARATWPASDALCAALQIINHLQDCADDYRVLGRVYLPLDDLASHGLGVEALGGARAGPALRACIGGLAERTESLLTQSRPLPSLITDERLTLEISVIQALAARLLARLKERDPLSEPVQLSKAETAACAFGTVGRTLCRRLFSRSASSHRYQMP